MMCHNVLSYKVTIPSMLFLKAVMGCKVCLCLVVDKRDFVFHFVTRYDISAIA